MHTLLSKWLIPNEESKRGSEHRTNGQHEGLLPPSCGPRCRGGGEKGQMELGAKSPSPPPGQRQPGEAPGPRVEAAAFPLLGRSLSMGSPKLSRACWHPLLWAFLLLSCPSSAHPFPRLRITNCRRWHKHPEDRAPIYSKTVVDVHEPVSQQNYIWNQTSQCLKKQ